MKRETGERSIPELHDYFLFILSLKESPSIKKNLIDDWDPAFTCTTFFFLQIL